MIIPDFQTARERDFAALLIVDQVRAATAGAQAIDLANGRLLRQLRCDELIAALEQQVTQPMVLLEVAGVADDVLASVLPHVDALVEERDLKVVVALDVSQIDVVAALLVDPRVQLLCEPSVAERVSALVAATAGQGRMCLHDHVAESEASRLARLNEEVARIADVLARLTRRDGPEEHVRAVADRRPGFAPEPLAGQQPIAPAQVRRTIRWRRMRDQFFEGRLFEDPAWDMLLDLFAAHLERAQVSVSSLCIAAAVAPTTALRWIGRMTEAGLIERQSDPFDRRRAFLRLSKPALDGMQRYFAAVRAAGLEFA